MATQAKNTSKTKPNKAPLGNTGYPQTGVKTTGAQQRGAGAATKGFTSRGPLA